MPRLTSGARSYRPFVLLLAPAVPSWVLALRFDFNVPWTTSVGAAAVTTAGGAVLVVAALELVDRIEMYYGR
jgi:hypothetical protein